MDVDIQHIGAWTQYNSRGYYHPTKTSGDRIIPMLFSIYFGFVTQWGIDRSRGITLKEP